MHHFYAPGDDDREEGRIFALREHLFAGRKYSDVGTLFEFGGKF